MKRVRIKRLGGNQITPPNTHESNRYSEPDIRFNTKLTAAPDDEANIEAEGGETALIPSIQGIPALFEIEGKKHSQGGVPLDVPEDSFIFSDTKKMKIKDPEILKLFGYTEAQIKKYSRGGVTPAEISKKYKINKYRETLQNPDSTKLERETAEMNIKNANLKLGQLALAQESMKGFPSGIPAVSLQFIAKFGVEAAELLPSFPEQGQSAPFGMNRPLRKAGVGLPVESEDTTLTDQPDLLIDENSKLYFKNANPETFNQFMTGTSMATKLFNLDDAKRAEEEYEKRLTADRVFSDADPSNPRGLWDPNSGIRQPAPEFWNDVQFTGENVAKDGGEAIKNEWKSYFKKGKAPKMDTEWTPILKSRYANRVPGHLVMKDGGVPKYDDGGMYQRVEDTFSGNDKLKELLYAKTLAALQNQSYVNAAALKRQGVDINKVIQDLTPDKALDAFLKMQKRNHSVFKSKGKEWIMSQAQSNPAAFNQVYTDLGLGVPDATEVALGQATYLGYRDLLEDRTSGVLEEDVTEILTPFIVEQEGAQDEEYGFDKQNDISRIDALGTNTTVGQLAGIEKPKETPAPAEEVVEEAEEISDVPPGETGETAEDPPFGYYPQDNLRFANALANLWGVKKYTPWSPKLDAVFPETTNLDTRRGEAAMAEAYNTYADYAQGYGTPHLTARMSDMAGKSMGEIANYIGSIENQNANLTNQTNFVKANIANQTNAANAQIDKRTYDEMTTANQQFDNSKLAFRTEAVQAFNDRLTNAVNTDYLNQMSQYYAIDPTTGGLVTRYNTPEEITAAKRNQTVAEQVSSMMKELEGTGISADTVFEFITGARDPKLTNLDTDQLAALQQMQGTSEKGGPVTMRRVKIKKVPDGGSIPLTPPVKDSLEAAFPMFTPDAGPLAYDAEFLYPPSSVNNIQKQQLSDRFFSLFKEQKESNRYNQIAGIRR